MLCVVSFIKCMKSSFGKISLLVYDLPVGPYMTYPFFFFPESFTADHKPLMGEAPEVRGYFLGCGFNSAGKRMWAGGEADGGRGGSVVGVWGGVRGGRGVKEERRTSARAAGASEARGREAIAFARPAASRSFRQRSQQRHGH